MVRKTKRRHGEHGPTQVCFEVVSGEVGPALSKDGGTPCVCVMFKMHGENNTVSFVLELEQAQALQEGLEDALTQIRAQLN